MNKSTMKTITGVVFTAAVAFATVAIATRFKPARKVLNVDNY